MLSQVPRITSVVYGAILLLFFLPFINIQCNHKDLEKVKGIELATGFRMGNHSTDSSQQMIDALDSASTPAQHTTNGSAPGNDKLIERNNFATVALLLAIGGFILSFLLIREMLQGIIALAGVFSMFLMRIQLDNAYAQTGNADGKNLLDVDVSIEYETGYWLVLIFFLVIAAINILNYIEQMKERMEEDDRKSAG